MYTARQPMRPSRAMARLRIALPDDDSDGTTAEDLEWLSAAATQLRALVDNAGAPMERAQALLEGAAEPLM
jgi:hypothetical protein